MQFKPELLVEDIDFGMVENSIIQEKAENSPKKYIIKGPFIECNTQNKNKRVYPKQVVMPQVEAYQKFIKENRAVGELNHPNSLEIDPRNISHKTYKLDFLDDNIVIGEALVGDTLQGKQVKALMDMDVKLAVSSRGSGTLKEGVVQKDYRYICNDIVWDPSAPSAFVEGIMEAKTEFVISNGILVERDIEDLQERLKNFNGEKLQKVIVDVFNEAFNKIAKNSMKNINRFNS